MYGKQRLSTKWSADDQCLHACSSIFDSGSVPSDSELSIRSPEDNISFIFVSCHYDGKLATHIKGSVPAPRLVRYWLLGIPCLVSRSLEKAIDPR